jgi:hypothetical protein
MKYQTIVWYFGFSNAGHIYNVFQCGAKFLWHDGKIGFQDFDLIATCAVGIAQLLFHSPT